MTFAKNMKRARRRNDLNRMKSRARVIYPHDKNAKCANHLQACSCPGCGNPRKYFNEKPIQEQRADISAAQEVLRA
ncbi:hypothetical protein LCGC14_0270910 [marine sediment metagenome]|uniref:Uncharacterized protein n=1 Tax=marine sediment metagenome TaxID=412755 RepID=A0A0F9UFS2_9ZZZZ